MNPIPETDVQKAIERCLRDSGEFRQKFLGAIDASLPDGLTSRDFGDYETLSLESVIQSQRIENREIDVYTWWRSRVGNPYAILIEVKLASGFGKEQGEFYRKHARSLVRTGAVRSAITVLVAHSSYFLTAQQEARFFDCKLPLDGMSNWVPQDRNDHLDRAADILTEAAKRMEEGKALGAKGLFVELYRGIQEECDRRGNGLSIRNHTTDWVYLIHPNLPSKHVFLGYRIVDAVAEIRIWHTYRGDREALARACKPPIQHHRRNTQRFLRLPPLDLSSGAKNRHAAIADEHELAAIVDAVEWLVKWWTEHGNE